jgi:hypothetical protein
MVTSINNTRIAKMPCTTTMVEGQTQLRTGMATCCQAVPEPRLSTAAAGGMANLRQLLQMTMAMLCMAKRPRTKTKPA